MDPMIIWSKFLNFLSLTFPICEMRIGLYSKSLGATELVLKKRFETYKLNFIATHV